MDFASLMSSQMSKASSHPTSSSASTSAQKYLKRADLEAERQATYRREQEEAAAAREAKLKRKREQEEDEAKRNAVREEKRRKLAEESRLRREREEAEQERRRRKRLGLPEPPAPPTGGEKLLEGQKADAASGELEELSEEDLIFRLRALNQPTTLFGETYVSRLVRYRSLTSTAKALTPIPPAPNNNLPIPTALSLLPETDIKVPIPAKLPTTPEGKSHLLRQLTTYFTLLLREWKLSLSLRPQEVKDTFQGKQAFAAYSQSLTAMVPLFRKFEHPDSLLPNGGGNKGGGGGGSGLPDSILLPLISIVGAAQERRYVDANDGYLRLSIGKAAWPIGVTMVGIHERSAREKLHEGEGGKAHVMGDEVTRKYLQAIKRCVSFAQTRWPPEDLGQLMG